MKGEVKNRKPNKEGVAASSDQGKSKSRHERFSSDVDLAAEYRDELLYAPLAGAVLFVVVLTVYVLTLHPSVSGGDNGELLGCACELGVAHPPGYPTFTMLGWLFIQLLPFGTPAFRVAVMSAAFNAAAAVGIMFSVQRWFLLQHRAEATGAGGGGWIGSLWPAVLAGGLYGLSPLVWTYSVQAEVFAMNNFFASLLIYLALLFNEKRTVGRAALGAFVIGLGLTNQHTLILFAAPVVIWSLAAAPGLLLAPPALAALAAAGLVGLTPYLFLFWAAKYRPLGSWGDTSTITGFMTHFLRKEYGTFQLYSGADKSDIQLLAATAHYFSYLMGDCLYIGAAFLLAGLITTVSTMKRRQSPAAVIIGAWVVYILVFHSLSNLPIHTQKIFLGIHMRFWMQPHIISFILIGMGVAPLLRPAGLWRPDAVVPAVAAALALQVGLNYRTLDQSNNWHISELGRAHLQHLPPNAIIISQGDLITNAMRYLQRCEGERRDVLLLDETMMTYAWMRNVQGPHMTNWSIKFPAALHSPRPFGDSFTMEQFLAVNGHNPKHPIFKAGAWLGDSFKVPDSGVPSWYTVPLGLVSRVLPKGQTMSREEWLSWYNKPGLFPKEPDHVRFDHYTWESLMRRIVLEWRTKVAFYFSNLAVDTGEKQLMDRAMDDVKDVLRLEEMVESHKAKSYILCDLHNAIGMLHIRLQRFDKTEADIIESNRRILLHFSRYLALSPKDPAELLKGQEKALVAFLEANPNFNRPILSEEQQRQPSSPPAGAAAVGAEPAAGAAQASVAGGAAAAAGGVKGKKKSKVKKAAAAGAAAAAGEPPPAPTAAEPSAAANGGGQEPKKKKKKKKAATPAA